MKKNSGECEPRRNVYQRERRKHWSEKGLCTKCGGTPLPGIKSCARCKKYYMEHNAKFHQQLRDETFAAYGGKICACCGETEDSFLTLDHKNNDGAEDRRRLADTYRGAGGWIMYFDLRKRGYPEGYQVLCMNCNWGRRRTGVCPHKSKGT